jgi:outer membrane protein assembly factor BamB
LVYPIFLWMGLLMYLFNHRTAYAIVLLWLLHFLSCTGLVKLNINNEYPNSSFPSWPVVYSSNLRQNAIDFDVLPPYQIIWKKGNKSLIPDQPLAIDNYLIYTSENGNITFLDIEKGDIIGESRIAPGFAHAPIINKNVLFYAANLGKETLVALNLQNLKKIWKLDLPHLYTSPLIWKDRLYVGTKDGQLFCVDKELGEIFWHFDAKSSLFGIPAEQDGKIFFCDVKGFVYCIDGLSGKDLWMTELQSNIYGGVVIGDQRLFVGTTAGIFYCMEKASGQILWQTETGGSIYSNASFKEDMIYLGNNANKILALNAENGQTIWEFQTKGIINTTPLLGKDLLYIGSWDKNLYVLLRRSGELVQRMEFKKPIKSSPLLYKGKLFIHIANDHFFCIGPKDSTKQGNKKS